MTNLSLRAFVAPAAIGLSIIVSMNLYVVQPLKDRLEQTRLQAEAITNDMASLSHSDTALDQIREEQAVAERRLDKIKLAGEIVRDEGLLFQRISNLSIAVNVSLERLDPQPRAIRASDETDVTSLRCFLEVSGSYGAIAMFVRDLEQELGITVVRSVHIAPIHHGEDDSVLASIETEHFAINPRAVLPNGGGR